MGKQHQVSSKGRNSQIRIRSNKIHNSDKWGQSGFLENIFNSMRSDPSSVQRSQKYNSSYLLIVKSKPFSPKQGIKAPLIDLHV